ncbi:MAG TPA: hypothetical protein PK637_18950 [Flavobacteriales bacterium]|nr:hypothetical protein [Flavobacteriales bacterium]HRE98849.1 hypothetical protein [Flavobacteriales bacterium]HRJ36948.1 hypothetical protein [Flavobacteriales bacterium]HRJ39842.1 hypothetical protein [Flavobacteriales bacterium]
METEKKLKLEESDEFSYLNPHPLKITNEEYMAVYFRTYRYEYFLEKGTPSEKKLARTFFLQLIAYWEMRVASTSDCQERWVKRMKEREGVLG